MLDRALRACFAKVPRRRRPRPHSTWHLDEMYVRIDGRWVYLWRAVDAEGEVLDVLVQSKRDKRAAIRLIRKLLRKKAMRRVRWSPTTCGPTRLPSGILNSRQIPNAVGGRITEPRIHISQRDDGSGRCRALSRSDQPSVFCRCTPRSTTILTPSVI